MTRSSGNQQHNMYTDHVPQANDLSSQHQKMVPESRTINLVQVISDVRIVFFHFESNRIVELLFEISNRII